MATKSRYDVVIVGARCAGATLATFLARAGASVLLLDKERLPSDQILSTHTIHPPGLDVLDDVGVGDAVRAVAPPTHLVRLRKNDAFVDIEFPDERAGPVLAGRGSTVSYRTRQRRLASRCFNAGDLARQTTPHGRSARRRVGRSGTRVPGGPRCGSRRPSLYGRTSGRCRGVPRVPCPARDVLGVLERYCVLAHRSGLSIRDVHRKHRGSYPRDLPDRSRSASHRQSAVRRARDVVAHQS